MTEKADGVDRMNPDGPEKLHRTVGNMRLKKIYFLEHCPFL
jgi:hypothetical protein